MITAEQLREAFIYCPSSGLFTWRRHQQYMLVGRVAGCLHRKIGYWVLQLNNEKIRAHIAAWVYVYGEYPGGDLDHKDLNRLNNAIANLRITNKSNNGANRGPQKNNTSGYKGVFWHERLGKWFSQIRVRGELKYLGNFSIKEDAAKAYDTAAASAFGEHAWLNFGARA